MPKSTIMYCHKEGGIYWHFYPAPHIVKLCKTDAVVLKVRVSETEKIEGCYWGWWKNKDEKFVHVYHHKNAVEICFPYGTAAAEKAGQGKLLPVSIEVIA